MDTINLKQNHSMSIPQVESLKPKKRYGWIITKIVVFLLILTIAVYGAFKVFLTDMALEKLEADLATATMELNKAVDDRAETARKLEHDQKVVEQKSDNKCKKWLAMKSYKDSKGMPVDEADMCALTELVKTPVAGDF
jgi:hypothetical protein